MTSLDIATGAPELPDRDEHDARLIAQVRNATIAECQRHLRNSANMVEVAFRKAGLPTIMVTAFESAAEMLEALRT